MKHHKQDRPGSAPLSDTLKIHPGPGDVFGTTGRGPSAHGIQGLPQHDGRVAQTHGSPSLDNSAHTKAGVAGGDARDTPRG